jgi:DNA-binding transcriptional regulator YhcF (GntR family)
VRRYEQVADVIRSDIAAGVYAPGDRLPSFATVAGVHGVAVNTVRKAYGLLKESGEVVAYWRGGMFVPVPDVQAVLADHEQRIGALELAVGL